MNSMVPLWGYNVELSPYLTAGSGASLQLYNASTAASQEVARIGSQWPAAAAAASFNPFANATMINSHPGVPLFFDTGPGMGLVGLAAAAPGAAAYGSSFGAWAIPAAPCSYPVSAALNSLQPAASFSLADMMSLMSERPVPALASESAVVAAAAASAAAGPSLPAAAACKPVQGLGLAPWGSMQEIPAAILQGSLPRPLPGHITARPEAPAPFPSANPPSAPLRKRPTTTSLAPPPPAKRATKSLDGKRAPPAPRISARAPASASAEPRLETGGEASRPRSPPSHLESSPRGIPLGPGWQRRLAVRLDGPRESYVRCLDYRTFDSVLSLGCDIAWALFPDPRVVELDPTMVVLVDSEGREWPCRYHALVSKHSYVLRSGWRQFVEANRVAKSDSVVLSRDAALDSLGHSRVHIELRRKIKKDARHHAPTAPHAPPAPAAAAAGAATAAHAAAADRDTPRTPPGGPLEQDAPAVDGSNGEVASSTATGPASEPQIITLLA